MLSGHEEFHQEEPLHYTRWRVFPMCSTTRNMCPSPPDWTRASGESRHAQPGGVLERWS
jgi:hypothetical protein